MQIIACQSVTATVDGSLVCNGQTAIDYNAVVGTTTTLDLIQSGEYFAGGFSSVAIPMLMVYGFKRLYYSIPRR